MLRGARQARAASSKAHLVGVERSPGICFTGGNLESFPSKVQICSCWPSTERTPPQPPSPATSRATWASSRTVLCFACPGELELPHGCSSDPHHVHPGDEWNFPWFTAMGERAQQSQNAGRGIRISPQAFVSSAQQKGHCPCSTD